MERVMNINREALERRLAVTEYIFDENNPNFYPKDEYNVFFINSAQNYFNDLLNAQGFVFLNDLLKYLGIKPRMVGQIAGWTKDRTGYIHIEISRNENSKELSLKIEHDGVIIFDVLGD